jgi:hypothetical protein
VHHRTVQIDHQLDATIFQFIILMFIYSLTCFGRSPAHHQELNDCSSSLWFYLRIVVIAVLFVVGPGQPEREQFSAKFTGSCVTNVGHISCCIEVAVSDSS